LDEKHLAAAVRYVENNPVRAGMVRRAWEYPWSSAKFHVGEQKKGFLIKDQDLLGLVADWRGFLQGDDSVGEKDLRHATKTGRPLVGHENLARSEKKTGRNLQKGKPGRKPPNSRK
jgi:putative transposase